MADVSERAPGSLDASVGGGTTSSSDGGVGAFYADLPNRLIGYLIDAVVVSAIAFVAAVLLSVTLGPVVTFDLTAAPYVTVDRALAVADAVVTTVLSATYFVLAWHRFGGTLGMRWLDMTISGAGGHRVTWVQGVVRWLFIGLPLGNQAVVSVFTRGRADTVMAFLLFVWYAVLAISVARDPRKQGFHDRVAGTIVVKAARTAPPDASIDVGGIGVR